MAITLAERLDDQEKGKKKALVRGPGGQLTEQTDTGIQQLSAARGLTAPPTAPVGAAGLGAGPDTAKMMGTPAQKTGAVSMAGESGQTLADRLRRKTERTKATAEEQVAKKLSETMSGFGSIGEKVKNLVVGETRKLTESQVPVEIKQAIDTSKLKALALGPEGEAEATKLLETLANPDSTPEQKNQATADLKNNYDIDQAAAYDYLKTDAAKQIAQSVIDPDQIKVDETLLTQMGYETPEQQDELLAALGMENMEELAGKSMTEVQDLVNSRIQEEFSQTESLRQMAADPNASPAERAEAISLLRDMGAVGVIATEAEMDDLSRAVAEADEITFGGETYQLADLLSDDTITGMVGKYIDALDNPDDPENKKYIEKFKNDPDTQFLAQFAESHKAAFQDLMVENRQQMESFDELQKGNQQFFDGLAGFPKDVLKDMGYDPDKLHGTDLTEGLPAILTLASGPQGAETKDLISKLPTDVAKQLSDLDETTLRRIGVTGEMNQDGFQSFIRYDKQIKAVDNLLPQTDPNYQLKVSELFFGRPLSPKDPEWKQLKQLSHSDPELAGKLAKLETAWKSSPDQLKKMLGDFDITSLASGKKPNTFIDLSTAKDSVNPVVSDFMAKYGSRLPANRAPTAAELSNIPISELQQLATISDKLPPALQAAVGQAITTQKTGKTNSILYKAFGSGNNNPDQFLANLNLDNTIGAEAFAETRGQLESAISQLETALSTSPDAVNQAQITEALNKLRGEYSKMDQYESKAISNAAKEANRKQEARIEERGQQSEDAWKSVKDHWAAIDAKRKKEADAKGLGYTPITTPTNLQAIEKWRKAPNPTVRNNILKQYPQLVKAFDELGIDPVMGVPR